MKTPSWDYQSAWLPASDLISTNFEQNSPNCVPPARCNRRTRITLCKTSLKIRKTLSDTARKSHFPICVRPASVSPITSVLLPRIPRQPLVSLMGQLQWVATLDGKLSVSRLNYGAENVTICFTESQISRDSIIDHPNTPISRNCWCAPNSTLRIIIQKSSGLPVICSIASVMTTDSTTDDSKSEIRIP
jgi:hypothetical protein